MENNEKICPHCGAKKIIYAHHLNLKLMDALKKLYQAKDHKANISKILNHNQIANFQKLKYWVLVKHTGKSGEWQLTYPGVEFIQGRTKVPEKVFTFRGKRVFDPEAGQNIKLVGFNDYIKPEFDSQEDYAGGAMPFVKMNGEPLFVEEVDGE